MAEQFACPSCGAPLDYDGSGNASMHCPFCNSSVLVPKDLLRAKRPGPPAAAPKGSPGKSAEAKPLSTQAQRLRHVRNLALAGRKAEAIQQLQTITGISPQDAQRAVEAMAAGRSFDLPETRRESAQPGEDQPASLDRVNSRLRSGQEVKPAPSASAGRPPQPAARRSAGSVILTDLRGLMILIIVAAVVLPFVLVPGAPLNDWWSRVNPFAFARVTLIFGKQGTGPGYFSDPRLIRVDGASGTIYVGDNDTGRVLAFDASGKFLTQWPVGAKAKGRVSALAAGRDGSVFVVGDDGKIKRYEGATGKQLGTVDYGRSVFESLAEGADGSLLAVADGETVVRFTSAGKVDLTIPKSISSVSDDSGLSESASVAVDGAGQIFVMDENHNAVYVYSPEGKYRSRFGSEGKGPGQFRAMNAIAVDHQGRIYVSDFDGLQIFDATGRYLDTISLGSAVARSLAFDDQNNLYIVTNHQAVIKYQIVK